MNKRAICLFATACLTLFLMSGCGAGAEGDISLGSPDTSSQDIQSGPITNDADNESTAPSENPDEKSSGGNENKDSFADANDMFESADLIGSISECSGSGCKISITLDEGDTCFPGAGGNEAIVYSDNTVFQMSTVKSDGSSYSLSNCEKSDLKNDAYVLLFGSKQADETYLAEKIISIQFN